MNLSSAILKTLSYSDVFDHPLTLDELHRFLVAHACREDILVCLGKLDLAHQKDGYYFLADRKQIVEIRKYRESVSQRAYERAHWYGRTLGRLPFVRMVALTGSLAMHNCDQSGDYDYMLVASRGRVWTARIFALLLNKFANIFGETLCPNLIVSETMLEWKEHNLYSARELAQMVLISGADVFNNLRVANKWIEDYLPNSIAYQSITLNEKPSLFRKSLEILLGGKLGDRFESWEMHRKKCIARSRSSQSSRGLGSKQILMQMFAREILTIMACGPCNDMRKDSGNWVC
jgi:hypothetical protein